MEFKLAYGKTICASYVCFVSPEVDPGKGENEERSGIPNNVLDSHGGRRATRRQPDLTIASIQVQVHVMLPCRSDLYRDIDHNVSGPRFSR